MYLTDAINEFISQKPNPETQRAYREDLTQLLECVGDGPVDSITVQSVAAFKQNLIRRRSKREGKPLAPATINKRLKLTRTFFRWCVAQGLIVESPATNVSLVKGGQSPKKKAIPSNDLETMIEALQIQLHAGGKKVSRQPKRDLFVLLALTCAGLRRGDMPQLRFVDCDLNRREFTLYRKGDRIQVVPVSHRCIQALKDWIDVRPACDHDHVLVSYRSKQYMPLTPRGVSELFRNISKRTTGLSRGPHSVRHRFVYNALDNNVSVPIIQGILGHSSPRLIYENYGVSDLEDQHRAVDFLNDKQKDSDDDDSIYINVEWDTTGV